MTRPRGTRVGEGEPGGVEPGGVEPGAVEPGAVEPRAEGASPIGRIAQRLGSAGLAAGAAASAAGAAATGAARRLIASARAARSPLPNVYELYPEARLAPRRDLGLKTIPVAEVRGTAVEGPVQRRGDFLPLPRLRGDNWQGRWQRLREAQESLAILPPIEVLQVAGAYWVVDGHNRVAVARYGGQDDIDAVVTHLHVPGEEGGEPRTGSLAAGLAGAMDLRAAGEGRLTPGSSVRRSGPGRER